MHLVETFAFKKYFSDLETQNGGYSTSLEVIPVDKSFK